MKRAFILLAVCACTVESGGTRPMPEGTGPLQIDPAARRKLLSYAWPGNVRQMRAMVRRVVTLAADGHAIGAGELRLEETSVPTTLLEELGEAEKRRVTEVLRQVGGSRTE